jgi:hypothetical protein
MVKQILIEGTKRKTQCVAMHHCQRFWPDIGPMNSGGFFFFFLSSVCKSIPSSELIAGFRRKCGVAGFNLSLPEKID